MAVNLSETREFYRQFKSQLTAEVVAGSDKQLQYNNNGVLGASSNLVFDATNKHLNIGGFPFINNGSPLPTLQIGEIYRLYETDTYTCGTFTNAAYGYNGNGNVGTYLVAGQYATAYSQTVGRHDFYTDENPGVLPVETTTVTEGAQYIITSAGGNFDTFGAADNNVDTIFEATSSGTASGGGVVQIVNIKTRMSIIPNGNVGIGTNTPQTVLHVKSMSSDNFGIAKLRLEDQQGRMVELQTPSAGTDNGRIGTITNHDFEINAGNGAGVNVITFFTDGSEKVRIANNGNLGVGADNPAAILHLQTLNSPELRISRSNDAGFGSQPLQISAYAPDASSNASESFGDIRVIVDDATHGNENSHWSFRSHNNGTVTEDMVIGYNGNVGIEATPDIYSDNTHRNLRIGKSLTIMSKFAASPSTPSYIRNNLDFIRINGNAANTYISADGYPAEQITLYQGELVFSNAPVGIGGDSTSLTTGKNYIIIEAPTSPTNEFSANFGAGADTAGTYFTSTSTGTAASGLVRETATITDRFKIDGSGNVGIGISNPWQKTVIGIAPTVAATTIDETADLADSFVLANTGSSTFGDRIPLVFNIGGGGGNNISAAIMGERANNANWDSQLTFWVNSEFDTPTNTDTIQKVMTITPDGQIDLVTNVGTNDAAAGLSIHNTSTIQVGAPVDDNYYGGGIRFYFTDASGTDDKLSAAIIARKKNSWSSAVSTNKDADIEFHTLNDDVLARRMVITPNGSVWMGEDSATMPNFVTASDQTGGDAFGRLVVGKNSTHTTGVVGADEMHINVWNSYAGNVIDKGSFLGFSDNYFSDPNYINVTRAAIKGATEVIGNNASGYMSFYTSGATANQLTEKMRITSAGNVGIGEDNPIVKLSVRDYSTNTTPTNFIRPAANAGIRISNEQSETGSFAGLSLISRNTGSVTQSVDLLSVSNGSGNTPDFVITQQLLTSDQTDASREVLRITSDGKIGIGTNSPLLKLHVQGDVTGGLYNQVSGQFVISGKTNTNKRLNIGFDTSTDKAFLQSGINGTGYNDLLLNPGGGKVGIGVTNPQSTLEVVNSFAIQAVDDNAVKRTFVKRVQGTGVTNALQISIPAQNVFVFIKMKFAGSRALTASTDQGTSTVGEYYYAIARNGSGSDVVLDNNVGSQNWSSGTTSAGGVANTQTSPATTIVRNGSEANTAAQVVNITLDVQIVGGSTGTYFCDFDILMTENGAGGNITLL